MKRLALILAGLFCLPMVGSSRVLGEGDSGAPQRGTGLAIDWHSIDGGGLMFSTGGGMTLGGTIGQADAGGPMTGGGLTLTGGFWVVTASACPNTCGDINGSGGNVDLVDFASFAVCFGGSASVSAACQCSDLNLDGAINLLDFATFSLIFNGSSTNVPPNCP